MPALESSFLLKIFLDVYPVKFDHFLDPLVFLNQHQEFKK